MGAGLESESEVRRDEPHHNDGLKRLLGRTGYRVCPVGIGTWSMGGSWGPADDATSMAALEAAVAGGIDFIDTADNYGDGRSERLIGRLQKATNAPLVVATKMGRRATAQEYTLTNFRQWIEASRDRLNVDVIDLVQLHCPPAEVYDNIEVFDALNELVREGIVRHYGVSVQTISQAFKCLTHPGVETLQVVFNLFRQRPSWDLFPAAKDAGVGIIARLPLASGLLTGTLRRDTVFALDDHRSFNRHGEVFDAGETFAGVDYETGLQAVEELRQLVPDGMSMAQFALQWVLMFDAVTVAIVGASKPHHVVEAQKVTELPRLSDAVMEAAHDLYMNRIDSCVAGRWD